MKTHLTLRTLVIAVAALLVATIGGTDARADEPKVGDKAPDFTLVGSDGKEYALSQLIGKRTVVLAWFPKAFTGGCTAECKSMKETGAEIRNFDVAYFTASVDEPEKNADFAKSLGLDFPILSDPSKKVATAYGVVHEGRRSPSAGPLHRHRRQNQSHRQTSQHQRSRSRHRQQARSARRREKVSRTIRIAAPIAL